MAIQFGIYTREAGKGFGVYIKAISGIALDHFKNRLGDIPEGSLSRGGQYVSTISERLKATATIEAAQKWIIRFRHLSEIEQLERIGNKWIKPRPSNLVSARVQYYTLQSGGKKHLTTFDLKELKLYSNLFDSFTITKSATRNKLFERSYYEELIKDDRIEVLAANIKHGAYAGFTVPNISKIRKRKLAFQDRHAGYRIVGGTRFWENR